MLYNKLHTKIIQITQILQQIWTTDNSPEQWATVIINPLYVKGDKSNPENYKGISLLLNTCKIL